MFPDNLATPIVVAVVGSARIDEHDIRWQQASSMGADFARSGFVVMTGGYGGLMAAVAQGATAAGGSTIGLPMSNWDYLTPDPAHLELRWSENYFERLAHLLTANFLVVLDGGIGTLSEMSLAWAIAQTESNHTKVIVVGEGIKRLLSNFMSSLVISEKDMNVLHFCESTEEILEVINRHRGNDDEIRKAFG